MTDAAETDTVKPSDSQTRLAFTRHFGPLLVAVLSFAVFLVSAYQSGIWEPYESRVASVAETMVDNQTWLSVELGSTNTADDSQTKSQSTITALPFEYWPVALSIQIGGLSELALRLPMILLMSILLGLLMYTVQEYTGRIAAWCAVLAALSLPLFVFHGRFAFGHGTAIASSAFAALLFINNGRKTCSWLYGLGWLMTAFAALSGGVLAMAIPLSVFACLWAYDARPRTTHRWLVVAAPIMALCLVSLGWWRAYVHSGVETPGAWLLGLLHMTNFDDIAADDKRPFFNLFVHQIGFGLFPFGAILPIVFADLCWNGDDEHPWLGPVLLVWCAMGFLGPALGLMHTHYGILISAPSAALALGIYIQRILTRPPQPALAFLSVVLVALLDSNLKHDTQLLADAILGSKVDSFPAEFPNWHWARRLNQVFLGLILLYQGGLHRWGKTAVRFFFYPSRALALLNRPILTISAVMPVALIINFFFPKVPFLRFGFLAWEGSGSHLFVSPRTQVLATLAGIGIWIVSYWILWGLQALLRTFKGNPKTPARYFNGLIVILASVPALLITSWLRQLWAMVWKQNESSWAIVALSGLGLGVLLYGVLWLGEWLVRKHPRFNTQTNTGRAFFRPKSLVLSAVIAGTSIFQLAVLNRLLNPVMGLGNMKAFLGQIVIVILAWMVLYWTLWAGYMLRLLWLRGREDGLISSTYDGVANAVDGTLPAWILNRFPQMRTAQDGSSTRAALPVPLILILVSLTGWTVFMNGPVVAAMTDNMSSKSIIDRYRELAEDDEQLYTFGDISATNSYYFSKLGRLDNESFKDLLPDQKRFFAVVPRKDLANANLRYAEVMSQTRGGQEESTTMSPADTAIPVLYDGGSRYYLVSNRIEKGEKNLSPIKKALPDTIPEEAKPVQVNFDDKIELVGWWVEPEFPKPGSPMTTHLIFRSLVDNPGNWKIFMHIDPVGAKQRIHGDHEPVQGVHPTKNWRKGQLIHDEYEIEVSRTHPIGNYKVHLGLYRGKPRMKINAKKTKQKHKDNRVEIGTIRLK